MLSYDWHWCKFAIGKKIMLKGKKPSHSQCWRHVIVVKLSYCENATKFEKNLSLRFDLYSVMTREGTVLRFEVKVAVWDFCWMFQKLPKTVLTCSLDLYWIYFVQKHTNYYIKVSNFVLNTWLLHYQIDQKLRFISKVVM